MINKFFKNERGATAIEYGLIAALIAMAIIGSISNVTTEINDNFTEISTTLQ